MNRTYNIKTATAPLQVGLNLFRNTYPRNINIVNTILIYGRSAFCWLHLFDEEVYNISDTDSDSGRESDFDE